MPESQSHKKAKSKAAGTTGKTEKKISRNRRLDAVTKNTATEVERSGNISLLKKAAGRLHDSGKSQKVLQVPQKDMDKAVEAMKNVGVSGSVKNMSRTKRKQVKSKK